MQIRNYPSFDEYASALGHPSLRLTVLGREVRPWAMGCCVIDSIRIRWARDGGPCLLEAVIEEHGVGLVTVEAPRKVSGNGVLLGVPSVMIIPGFTEVRAVSLDTVEWSSVFIPSSRLQIPEEAEARPLPVHVMVSMPAGNQFPSALSRIITAAMNGAFESNPLGQREAAKHLVEAARELLWPPLRSGTETHHAGRHLIPRREILHRIYKALESSYGEILPLDDLAKTAGISIRTLHNAFIEQTGVSPKRFVRLRLLNTARRELLRADPGHTRVVDIAAGLGIWEWGRFAHDYRGLFGELPSETLRRRS
ncbi:MAG: AraC family transcriptional regulator [Verrucomicrobiaceae bacterium]|nr:MAG: AraC family transcriptional regulator [Verrucomicrobiaceae bacterium]